MGRDDDMIKVAGHRLSTGKIEEVIAKVKGVVECAVVPKKDTLKGEVPIAFVVCERDVQHVKKVKDDIMLKVINDIGRICALKDVIVVDKLPKTRSGKIIRQLLKGIVNNDTLYIPPTIEDKDVVKHIIFIFSKSKL
jgi:propionyl-CoA synthetase